jgi:hypothetical protein
VQSFGFADAVFNIGAIITHRAVDIGSATHQVAELAAEAVADRADLAVALLQTFQVVLGIFHVLTA